MTGLYLMHFLRSLNVGKRLATGFGLLLLLMVVIIAAEMHSNKLKADQFHEVIYGRMIKVIRLEKLLDIGTDVASMRRFLMIQGGKGLDADEARMQAMNAEYAAHWDELAATFRYAKTKKKADRIIDTYAAIEPAAQKFMQFLREKHLDAARAVLLDELRDKVEDWQAAIGEMIEYQKELAGETEVQYYAIDDKATLQLWILGALSLLIGGLISWLITRSLTAPLGEAVCVADGIAGGKLDHALDETCHDEVGNLLLSMQRMQDTLRHRIEHERTIADENLRIRSALDNSNACTFVTDADGTLIYANRAFITLMQQHEASIRHKTAGFSAATLLGGAFESLGISAASMHDIKRALSSEGHAHVREEYADAVFDLDIALVRDEAGKVLGQIHQWVDRTMEVAIEKEISIAITAAVHGDLSKRVKPEGKTGNFLHRSHQLNSLLDSTSRISARISGMLSALAAGDLSARVEGDFEGEYARIRDDANRMAAQLTQIVGRIQQASGIIQTAAREISSGNADLSRRTEQQAANLEETAASMEELTTTVRNNAEHAREANQLTLNAVSVAQQGGNVVGQVVTTMSEIEAASRKITDIITVIDGIAFQTNILALNAAVEAARAGEQGRGFAVVATEVRSLAQRSATAAREIKTLIEDSTGKVGEGAQLAGEAGRTMGEIVASVQQVTDIMAEISNASQEQASGIEQVNQTIMQMDETTQKNAALVEEAAASAGSMEQQASALAQAVSMFKIETSLAVAA